MLYKKQTSTTPNIEIKMNYDIKNIASYLIELKWFEINLNFTYSSDQFFENSLFFSKNTAS